MSTSHHELLNILLDGLDTAADGKNICIQPELAECRPRSSDLGSYSILGCTPLHTKEKLVGLCSQDSTLDRIMGTMCGMAVGDALGHPFEFTPAVDQPGASCSFDLKTMEFIGEFNKFGLERGQWTDDASMGICMADSLIMQQGFDGGDMRLRFWNWWFRGYTNPFSNDTQRESKESIGLGGNVAKSLEILNDMVPGQPIPSIYESDSQDAGNGSIMRLASIPIFFRSAPKERLCEVARSSSLTTHPGQCAAEACAFLAYIVSRAIDSSCSGSVDARAFLDGVTQEYLSDMDLVNSSGDVYAKIVQLIKSEPIEATESCWNWKSVDINIERSLEARGWEYNGYPVNRDYFGSYSLDGLAVALWCIYHTNSFDEAVTRAVNCCGDADSFGSITGQIAGALYGYSAINPQFIQRMVKWDGYDFATRAILLDYLGATAQKRTEEQCKAVADGTASRSTCNGDSTDVGAWSQCCCCWLGLNTWSKGNRKPDTSAPRREPNPTLLGMPDMTQNDAFAKEAPCKVSSTSGIKIDLQDEETTRPRGS